MKTIPLFTLLLAVAAFGAPGSISAFPSWDVQMPAARAYLDSNCGSCQSCRRLC